VSERREYVGWYRPRRAAAAWVSVTSSRKPEVVARVLEFYFADGETKVLPLGQRPEEVEQCEASLTK